MLSKKIRLTRRQKDQLEVWGHGFLFALQVLAATLAFGVLLEMIVRMPNVS